MKNVWVLEKYITVEEMKKSLMDLFEMRRAQEGNDENIALCDQMIEAQQKKVDENPDGYWLGYEGKTIYKQFCSCAADFMRRHREEVKSGDWKLRVVKAEIEDNATMWPGYVNGVENEGVLKYLLATM